MNLLNQNPSLMQGERFHLVCLPYTGTVQTDNKIDIGAGKKKAK
jgi:hypothetical protein